MMRMDCDAVVVLLATLTEIVESAFLFFEVKTGGIREEERCEDHASKAKPWHHVEFLLGGDIVVHDGCGQSTELSYSGREAMSGGANRCRINLSCNEECRAIGSELVEERREEVHGLESSDVRLLEGVVMVVECRHDKQNEVHEKAELLHPFPSYELVVDEE